MRKSSPFNNEINTSSWGNLLEYEFAELQLKQPYFRRPQSHTEAKLLCMLAHTALSDTAIPTQGQCCSNCAQTRAIPPLPCVKLHAFKIKSSILVDVKGQYQEAESKSQQFLRDKMVRQEGEKAHDANTKTLSFPFAQYPEQIWTLDPHHISQNYKETVASFHLHVLLQCSDC